MYQQAVLIGNIGSDIELRTVGDNDIPVCNFSLAVNTKVGNEERTTWWRVTCWRGLAEIVAQYMSKGRQIMVMGKDIRVRPYTNKAGEAAASLEITAQDVTFLGARGDGDGSSRGGGASRRSSGPPSDMNDVDEIPF